ncbi:MAG TPA: glycosyltransferase [Planctomycetaceae bacterium]
MFNANTIAETFAPRHAGEASQKQFLARLKICQRCPVRRVHTCRVANQLCTLLARPAGGACPNRSWPSDSQLTTGDIAGVMPALDDTNLKRGLQQAAGAVAARPGALHTCAVVIISHNYGRFLAEGVESVLAQTVRPAEVLIVDDASSDDTAAVAARFGDRGVQYLRVENRSITLNRLCGLERTTAPVVLFLDADDALDADYLERGLPLFSDPRIGIVYSDCQRFGDDPTLVKFPLPGQVDINHQNFAHAGSLVRRAALEASDAFAEPGEVTRRNQDDWYLWRRLAAAGWRLDKQDGIYLYRIHGASHCAELKALERDYFDLGSLAHETITLFVPLSGRRWAWPDMRHFLERQTWPHDRTRLIFADTSDDEVFSRDVRSWLASCDYTDARHYWQTVGEPGLADDNRREKAVHRAVQGAMPRIYNRLAREATTEYILVVEDDILPPADVAERLLRGFDDVTASVSALYASRFRPGYVAWDSHGRNFLAADVDGRPVVTVGGNGFGCVMLRRSVLRETVFQHALPTGDYDPNFYHWLTRTKWQARLDCRILCEHRDAPSDLEAAHACR